MDLRWTLRLLLALQVTGLLLLLIFWKGFLFEFLSLGILFLSGILLTLFPAFRKTPLISPEPTKEFDPIVETVLIESSTPSAELLHEADEAPLNELVGSLRVLFETIPVVEKLQKIVVGQTERAAMSLTGDIFELSKSSQNVGSRIQDSLMQINSGDTSLSATAGHLKAKVGVFEELAGNSKNLKATLESEIKVLTKTVENINEFSDNLSDLADQTNVLAINASIEAARVGIQGRGFAVIATQVQVLARNSKEIAEKMARMVQEVVAAVRATFEKQSRRLVESENLIRQSEKDLRTWADLLVPQVGSIHEMIEQTRGLADEVTNRLGRITVSLQFQDKSRQILEHMSRIMAEVGEDLSKQSPIGQNTPSKDQIEIRKRAQERAAKHFTMIEEWDAVDPVVREIQSNSQQGKIGTIELF